MGGDALSRLREGSKRPRGQVLVEVLLMLPIFLLLVFTVMEIGHLAFRTIMLHHAAYEVARVGSLTAYAVKAQQTCVGPNLKKGTMDGVRGKILKRSKGSYKAEPHPFSDPQDGCQNYDLVVTLFEDVSMIFPMTGLVLGNTKGRRARRLSAQVRMPIERPLFGGRS
jgi:hypothetical protein